MAVLNSKATSAEMAAAKATNEASIVAPKTERIGFLLQPRFSMLSLFSALEPLRVVNRFSGSLFSWHFLSIDGEPVMSSSGIPVAAEQSIESASANDFSIIFVCASFEPEQTIDKQLVSWLRLMGRKGLVLGGIETGCYALAYANLLDDHEIALHWESKLAFQESFPLLKTSEQLYQIDDKRITCAGGASSMDMMLDLIERKHGKVLSEQICAAFMHEPVAHSNALQRLQTVQRLGIRHADVARVIDIMEQHLEEPLTVAELVETSGIEQRKLERIFKQHCHDSPIGFYLRLRLERARQLLKQSQMSVVAVAVACGFHSPEYFSRRYRKVFGMSPREDRKLAAELSRMSLNRFE